MYYNLKFLFYELIVTLSEVEGRSNWDLASTPLSLTNDIINPTGF